MAVVSTGQSVDRIQKDQSSSNASLSVGMALQFGARHRRRAIASRSRKATEVVIVEGARPDGDEITGAAIGHHLFRYGIEVDVNRIVVSGLDVAIAILYHERMFRQI
jgi:hypothetical protein